MRIVALASICCWLCGCVPVLSHTYYRPDAPDGEVVTNFCWKMQDSIRIRRPGLLSEMRVITRDGKRYVQTLWEIDPDKTVEVTDSKARVVFAELAPKEIELQLGASAEPMDLQPLSPMVGGYFPPPHAHYPRNFWMYLALPDPLADSFRVLVPAYEIDGKADSLPEVRFTKQTSVQLLAPIQC